MKLDEPTTANVVKRWLRCRRHRAAESVIATYADLRVLLPAEYRDRPDVEIPTT